MHPIFLAHGPAFKNSYKIKSFNNVDIYPLMCSILGVKPAANNGSLDNVVDMLKSSHYANFGLVFVMLMSVSFLVTTITIIMVCYLNRNRSNSDHNLDNDNDDVSNQVINNDGYQNISTSQTAILVENEN